MKLKFNTSITTFRQKCKDKIYSLLHENCTDPFSHFHEEFLARLLIIGEPVTLQIHYHALHALVQHPCLQGPSC
jgi:hypothetical protein